MDHTLTKVNVDDYLDYVKDIVTRKYGRISNELEDLIAIGYLALTKAVKTYRDDKGASFKTYLSIRVMGDIVDYFRRSPHKTNKKLKKYCVQVVQSSLLDGEEDKFIDSIQSTTGCPDIDYLKQKVIKRLDVSYGTSLKSVIPVEFYLDGMNGCTLAAKHSISKSMVSRILSNHYIKDLILEEIQNCA